jgi:hypothetical protein
VCHPLWEADRSIKVPARVRPYFKNNQCTKDWGRVGERFMTQVLEHLSSISNTTKKKNKKIDPSTCHTATQTTVRPPRSPLGKLEKCAPTSRGRSPMQSAWQTEASCTQNHSLLQPLFLHSLLSQSYKRDPGESSRTCHCP